MWLACHFSLNYVCNEEEKTGGTNGSLGDVSATSDPEARDRVGARHQVLDCLSLVDLVPRLAHRGTLRLAQIGFVCVVV